MTEEKRPTYEERQLATANQVCEKLKKLKIAARIPAEPGWFVVTSSPTGLKDVETMKEDEQYVRLRGYEIKEWGLPDPLVRPEPEKKNELGALFLSMVGVGSLEVTTTTLKTTLEQLPRWLPIDPTNRTRFISPGRIIAFYSPDEVKSVSEAIAETQRRMAAILEAKREKEAAKQKTDGSKETSLDSPGS
jgi:hypothetical protein